MRFYLLLFLLNKSVTEKEFAKRMEKKMKLEKTGLVKSLVTGTNFEAV